MARKDGSRLDVRETHEFQAGVFNNTLAPRDATVIVVGTAGESPLKGAMLGSTPHKLLQLSARPVLCVPAGD